MTRASPRARPVVRHLAGPLLCPCFGDLCGRRPSCPWSRNPFTLWCSRTTSSASSMLRFRWATRRSITPTPWTTCLSRWPVAVWQLGCPSEASLSKSGGDGRPYRLGGGYTHIVRNAGATPLHFIDVELRTSAPAAAAVQRGGGAPAGRHARCLANARVACTASSCRLDVDWRRTRHARPVARSRRQRRLVSRGVASPSARSERGQYRLAWRTAQSTPSAMRDGSSYQVVEI